MTHAADPPEADAARIVCDLRSDTVTRPDAPMRAAMAAAAVGDDVYGDDPTVNALEAHVAALLAKEAAVFVPSGTQGNLCALLSHCARGEEAIAGRAYHVLTSEAAGASVLGGIALCPVEIAADGGLDPEVIDAAVKPDDPHCPVSRLLCLENTFHGRAVPMERLRAAAAAGRRRGLSVHLDGARFFNAVVELSVPPAELAGVADTVSLCLSKGLGAPAGTVLAGPSELIGRARRWRKMLGGGMRQAGVIAAAGLHALRSNVAGLAEDHRRAGQLAQELRELTGGAQEVAQATNMVFLGLAPDTYMKIVQHMRQRGIVLNPPLPAQRLVLHRDVGDAELAVVLDEFRAFFGRNSEA